MTRVLIRVEGDLSEELVGAFPGMRATLHRAQTTLAGDVVDQQEMQGLLNFLSSLGISVVEVLTIPD